MIRLSALPPAGIGTIAPAGAHRNQALTRLLLAPAGSIGAVRLA